MNSRATTATASPTTMRTRQRIRRRGIPDDVVLEYGRRNGLRLVTLTDDPRARGRRPMLLAELLPRYGVALVATTRDIVALEDGAVEGAVRNIRYILVPEAYDYTADTYWTALEDRRARKYGEAARPSRSADMTRNADTGVYHLRHGGCDLVIARNGASWRSWSATTA